MRFRTKIFAVLTVVGLLPLGLLGWLSFTVNRDELEQSASAGQELLAVETARSAEHAIARGIEGLRLSLSLLPFDELGPAEIGEALHIPYGQLQFIDAIALVDETGAQVAPPVFDPRPGSTSRFRPADLSSLLHAAPLELAVQVGTALGAPYRDPSGESHVAVAVRVSQTGAPIRVAVAQFSLGELRSSVREIARAPTAALVVASDGASLASAGLRPEEEAPFRELAVKAASARGPSTRVVAGWLASFAPVGGLGWVAVVAQPVQAAWRPALRVGRYTLFWMAVTLLLTAGLGFLISRSLTGPMEKLKRLALALQEGRYGERVEIAGRDELADLAASFGHMASEVQRRDEEIRAWNVELQARVEERTAELKTAQDQILRARRLAAIGSLGAGLAHEINNPLMALGGLLTLIEREAVEAQGENLQKAREQVARVAAIVKGLLEFSRQERAAQGRRFALVQPVQAVLQRYAERLSQRSIQVSADLAVGRREAQGDPVQIEQVVEHLVRNAMQAMPKGGQLQVSVGEVGGDSLKLVVSDTGKGIAPAMRERIFDPFFSTKEDGGEGGTGLGLSITHSIVEAHHGKIVVDSVEGRGSTFTVVLPAAAAAAHLS